MSPKDDAGAVAERRVPQRQASKAPPPEWFRNKPLGFGRADEY
jgi:hypothetical protein